MSDFDVLIVGAGPAGCATALSLASFAPRLAVGLINTAKPSAPRIGEMVPPQIKPMLAHLGLSDAFAADRHCASYRTLSAWGSPALMSNEFLFHVEQTGWRLDRTRFDAMMLRAAARDATVIADSAARLDHADDLWRLKLADGTCHGARAMIDATGRAAVLARLRGLRVSRLDRLTGCVAFCDDRSDAGELTIEAVPDGWWYTAALPARRRVVALMSDADIVRRLGAGRTDGLRAALRATTHVAAAVADAPLDPPHLLGAGSQIADRDPVPTLLAVGDAASCFDPVSGQGIVRALRSGVFASYAIADRLERNDGDGLRRYATFVASEFAAYRKTLRDYYRVERRWPDGPFWQRRHAEAASEDGVRRTEAPAPAMAQSRRGSTT